MNRRIITLLATIGILLSTFGCGESPPTIVGEWTGTGETRLDSVMFLFKEDNTVIWTIDKAGRNPYAIVAKYSIDSTVTPVQINISDISFLEQGTIYGIIEFKGKDTMLFDGLPDKRPKEFGPDALELQRSK